MKTAEITLTTSHNLGAGFVHVVGFSDVVQAESEYERIVALLEKRKARSNDLPKMLKIDGINSISVSLDDVCSVGFNDLEKLNAEEKGMKDAYPNILKK